MGLKQVADPNDLQKYRVQPKFSIVTQKTEVIVLEKNDKSSVLVLPIYQTLSYEKTNAKDTSHAASLVQVRNTNSSQVQTPLAAAIETAQLLNTPALSTVVPLVECRLEISVLVTKESWVLPVDLTSQDNVNTSV